jgi:hypothetical protein
MNKLGLIGCFLIGAQVLRAAAPFQNLDFELANTNTLTSITLHPGLEFLSGAGPASDLLPYWKIDYGDTQLSFLNLNKLALDGGSASIISQDAQGYFSYVFPNGIDGNYGLGFSIGGSTWTLSQQGLIPPDARLLEIKADGSGAVDTRINGQLIQNGDISRFAGQVVDLELSIYATGSLPGGIPTVGLNSISFVVPEPSTSVCFAIGIAALASLRVARARKKCITGI